MHLAIFHSVPPPPSPPIPGKTYLEDFSVAAFPEHFLQFEVLWAELHPARVDDFL